MPSSQMKLLVRADAGPGVGTGHLMRSIALGQAWQKTGGAVFFICGQLPNRLVKHLESQNFRLFNTRNDRCDVTDAKFSCEIASVVRPDWIALDGNRFNDAYQHQLRQTGSRLFVLDDSHGVLHSSADLILNQHVDADRGSENACGVGQKTLTGSRYALLRTEFTNLNSTRRIAREAKRLLVTFGGADPDNWTLKTLQILSDLDRKRLVVDCVIGACYPHMAELEMFKLNANMSLRIHRNVDRMSALMSKVDLAITAGGATCYELARCGVPAIVTSITDSQLPVARTMNDQGAMISIDGENDQRSDGPRRLRLAKAIRKLINSSELRQEMAARGKRLVDGKGAQRIVQQMIAMLFPLRNAVSRDAETTWHWRNDPEVRSVSFDSTAVSLSHHRRWLVEKLENPEFEVWIAEDQKGRPVGQVCIDHAVSGQSVSISVIVDQARRGRGLGKVLIAGASNKLFQQSEINEIIAQIKPGNTASEKAFRAAGYQAIEPAIINGKMALQFALPRNQCAPSARPAIKKSA